MNFSKFPRRRRLIHWARRARLSRIGSATKNEMGFRAALVEACFTCVLAVSATAAGAPASAKTVVKGPYLTSLSDRAATVRFELDALAPAAVEITRDSASAEGGALRPTRFESIEVSAMHAVALTGLTPSTRYAYSVRAGASLVANGHFVTGPSPDANEPSSFLVYGDDRTDDEAHAAVVRAMSTEPSDFLVHTGDMVEDGGSAADWATFFRIEGALLRDRPLFAAIGNHELYDDAAGANFARYFGFRDGADVPRAYGTVRLGNVRLFFLNGMHDWASGPEREWLERALATADAEPGLMWRFAVTHHGPWSSGPHGPNIRFVEARVPELLAAHKVDLLFSGHDHIYERGDAGILKYIVSGGGGAPLYRDLRDNITTRKIEPAYHFVQVTTRGAAVEIVARRVDGSVLDRCGFVKGGSWDCDTPSAWTRPSSTPSVSGPPNTPADPPVRRRACACDLPGSRISETSFPVASVIGLAALAAGRRRALAARRRPVAEPAIEKLGASPRRPPEIE